MQMQARFYLILVLFLLASTALADSSESVERHYVYDVSQVDELRIDFRVGKLRIEPATGDSIEVDLRIKVENGGGWWPLTLFRSRPDLSGMELTSRSRGGHLWLSFDEKNVSTDWVLRLPTLADLRIKSGVGVIEGELPPMPADIDLGVGEIELSMPAGTAGLIDLSAGVGETRIRGGRDHESRRAVVSSEASALGEGEHRLRARVGVGEATVDLR